MTYLITPMLFMVRTVEDGQYRRLKTLSEKYALIQNLGYSYYFDGTEITGISPLYRDGKYYEISGVVKPKPNLYEFLKWNNPAIQRYIDTQDSIILDKEKSKPLGFNEQGKTVYDSVTTVINLYEEKYFTITEEYRDIFATLVIPDQATYELAMDDMAKTLGGTFQSHEDIPVDWQNNLLIPVLLHKGTYGGLMYPVDFEKEKVTNIVGDSILIDFEIDPASMFICSNGLTYKYASFTIGDTLYRERTLEAESVCDSVGLKRFSWHDDKVLVEGNKSFQPVEQKVMLASNDSIVSVDFDRNYQGEYAISFTIKYVFPGKHRLVWRTNYRITGRYSIYANGEKVGLGISENEEYDTYNLINGFFSVMGYKLYPDRQGFCSVDGWVETAEYGNVTIKLEYQGPGKSSENGLLIDYIALLREESR
jgi:hypothetical protein